MRVHGGQPRRLADIRVAVEQHQRAAERGILDDRTEPDRIHEPEVQVAVAEAGVDLHRHPVPGGDLKRPAQQGVQHRLGLEAASPGLELLVGPPERARDLIGIPPVDHEPGPVRHDAA